MAALNLEQLEVESFDTTEPEPEPELGGVTVPQTQPIWQCQSPWCVPTMVCSGCDTATNPI